MATGLQGASGFVLATGSEGASGSPGKVLGKRWVVGKTVLRQIGAATKSTDMGEWIGKEVTMFPTACRGKEGKEVECIRVRVRVDQHANEVSEDMAADPEPTPEFDPGQD